jgi:putative transposase
VKYAFIKGNSGTFPLRLLCSVLRVSRSGYYAWLRRYPKGRRRLSVLNAIKQVHKESRQSYGSPRVFRALKNGRVSVGKGTVERIMREHNIRGKKRRYFKRTTDSRHAMPIAENLVERRFDRGAKNRVWLSDITYLRLRHGWAYLAAIIDGHSRKIVGFSVKDHMRIELVTEALSSAFWRERPENGLLIHSDRGSQYASDGYRTLIKSFNMTQSMSRRGDCWDNAPMESFFDSLKTELIGDCVFENVHEAKTTIFEWIEVFYNRKRIHSALGYLSPACFEEKYLALAA